jgi:hypothetical protein
MIMYSGQPDQFPSVSASGKQFDVVPATPAPDPASEKNLLRSHVFLCLYSILIVVNVNGTS